MWCQATCFLFVIFLSSCEPRKIYIGDWYETTNLTPRTSTSGESERNEEQGRKVDIEIIPLIEPEMHIPAQEEEEDSAKQQVSKPSKPYEQHYPLNKSTGSTNRTKRDPHRRIGNMSFLRNYRRFVQPTADNCPANSTVCEGPVDGYPFELISKALQEHGERFWTLKGNGGVIPGQSIAQRIDFPGELAICPSQVVTMNPNQGINKDHKWHFIVNHPEFQQGITFETCQHNDACGVAEGFPLGYNTYCKQKYIYRRMLVVNDKWELVPDEIKIPSCCSCFYQHNLAKRMAVLPEQNMTPATSCPTPPNNK